MRVVLYSKTVSKYSFAFETRFFKDEISFQYFRFPFRNQGAILQTWTSLSNVICKYNILNKPISAGATLLQSFSCKCTGINDSIKCDKYMSRGIKLVQLLIQGIKLDLIKGHLNYSSKFNPSSLHYI